MTRSCFLMILFCAVLFTSSLGRAYWEPPVRLVQDSALLPYNNARGVAAGQDGAIHVVWWLPNGGGAPGEIYYKRSTNYGTTWSQKIQLSTNIGGWTDCPAIAASGTNVHVVWEDGNGALYYKRSTNGGASWSGQTNLSGITPWAHMPSLAVSGSNVHAVWADRRNGGGAGSWFIYYRRSMDNGATWSVPESLTFATTDFYEDPRPSVSASANNVYITWQDSRDLAFSHEIYFRRSLDNGNSWSADTRLTNGAYSYYFTPRPTIASSGSNVHIVWEDTLGDGGNFMYQYIYYIRSTDQGATWSNWVRLIPDTIYAEQVTVTASGSKVHVASMAYSASTGRLGIFYSCSTDDGATWPLDTLILAPADSIGYDHPFIAVSDTILHLVFGNGNTMDGRTIFYSRNGNPPIGIESETGPARPSPCGPFNVNPNPFISFTTIPGHESERFALYDIAGQRIVTFRGDRIGEGLPPGVYFLKPEDGSNKSARLVKVR
jgi:hypothetical protein